MALNNIIFLWISIFFTGWHQCAAVCDMDNFVACLTPLQEYGSFAGGAPQGGFNETQLRDMCSKFQNVTVCAAPKITTCAADERLMWDVIDSTFSYLCGDGMQPYIDNSACLDKATVKTGVDACRRTEETQTQRLTESVWLPRDERFRELCRIMDETTACITSAVSLCPLEAVDVMVNLTVYAFAPSRKFLNCGVGLPPSEFIETSVPDIESNLTCPAETYATYAHSVRAFGNSNCSFTMMASCMDSLLQTLNDFNYMNSQVDAATLDIICNTIPEVDACMKAYTSECSFDETISWRMLQSSMGYMCKDGREDYLQYSPCMYKPEVQKAIGSCADSLGPKLMSDSGSVCSALNIATKCNEQGMLKICEQKAIDTMIAMYHFTFLPYRKQYNCKDTFYAQKQAHNASSALTSGMISFLIILLLKNYFM